MEEPVSQDDTNSRNTSDSSAVTGSAVTRISNIRISYICISRGSSNTVAWAVSLEIINLQDSLKLQQEEIYTSYFLRTKFRQIFARYIWPMEATGVEQSINPETNEANELNREGEKSIALDENKVAEDAWWKDTRIWINLIGYVAVTVALVVIKVRPDVMPSTERGFHCEDPDLSYPVRESTVHENTLFISTCSILLMSIFISEGVYAITAEYPTQRSLDNYGEVTLKEKVFLFVNLMTSKLLYAYLGLILTMNLTYNMQHMFSGFRPDFLTICNPKTIQCSASGIGYFKHCSEPDKDKLAELRLKCFEVIDEKNRVRLIEAFNAFPSKDAQDSYLASLITVTEISQHRPCLDEPEKSNSNSYYYKVFTKSDGEPPVDGRGKHTSRLSKMFDELKQRIRDHISSFRGRQSLYSQERTRRLHLPADLNIHKMFLVIKEKHSDDSLPYESYRTIFKTEFNISFGYPRSDTCDQFKAKIEVLIKTSRDIPNEAVRREVE
ncbi:vitamin B12-dependent ribonucleotide reductase [Plakobranchus ocellatus]|uniref:Vitamin B12-dependent ribonucleotide reductase n=1 Tax=Plakobranchus ocellatus TaxID=259542 RepID=A0AAV4BVB8_9GAST|nr:vitamin B12-dependent ribonucleotide reductase [Plakobranchus ocellatus]